jgi:hypothetical protein
MAKKSTISKYYIQGSNKLDDVWIKTISPNEFMVLRFIYNRTVRWNRLEENIPRRHVEHGVASIEAMGVRMSYKTWAKCLRLLRDRGLIHFNSGLGLEETLVEINLTRILRGPM